MADILNAFASALGAGAGSQDQSPLINGYRFSFSSIEIRIGTQVFGGARACTYSQPKRPGPVWSNKTVKIARTRGKLEPTASVTFLRGEADKIREALGPGYRDKAFNMNVSFREGTALVTDVIKGCLIVDEVAENGSDTSIEPVAIRFDLDPMYIIMNGIDPVFPMAK